MFQMTELTELEMRLLRTLPKENFYEDGFDSTLWTDCFLDTLKDYEGIDQKQSRGILSSLSKKGYLNVWLGKDGTINLLEPAKQWLLENKIVDENGKLRRV
jgi:hypothetical protein